MSDIIITTTPSIDGHLIKKYLGLVSYRALGGSSDICISGLNDKGIEKYRKFIKSAQAGLQNEATLIGANAVVGVQILPPTGGITATQIVIGTAVIIE